MNTKCSKSASVVPEAMGEKEISPDEVLFAAKEGFRSKEDDDDAAAEQAQENQCIAPSTTLQCTIKYQGATRFCGYLPKQNLAGHISELVVNFIKGLGDPAGMSV